MASGLLRALLVSVCAVGALGAPSGAAANATFTVLNLDDPDEGLNDPTPFPGALGNPAMTLGEARRNVLDAAADFWGGVLTSAVPIRVASRFNPLGGGPTSATLGLGTPSLLANYSGAPFADTWIPSALADKLAGVDKDPGDDDIEVEFNSNVDGPVVLGSSVFYYGLDGNPPGDDVDFFTIVLHEIAHGLGFSSSVSELTGSKTMGFDDLFSAELECPAGVFLALSDPQRVVCGSSGTDLHWSGASVTAAAADLTDGVAPDGHVRMYAPLPVEFGSSISHFDKSMDPDELMEPFKTGPKMEMGLTANAFEDIGWGCVARTPEDADVDGTADDCDPCPSDPTNTCDPDGDGVVGEKSLAPCATGETAGCDDNCPFEPNALDGDVQRDSDGNGRGDACECGNVDRNTSLNIFDALMIAQGTLKPPLVAITHPRACDSDGNGSCDIFDALRVAQATLVPPLASIVQACSAATVAP